LTSNRKPLDWYPLFPNPVVAESLLDRLINTSHQAFMDGPSYRPRKRPGLTNELDTNPGRRVNLTTQDLPGEFHDGQPWGIT
jgi:hypothetical protein